MFKKKDKTKAKTYGGITDKEGYTRLDFFDLEFMQEMNTIIIRSKLTKNSYRINADTLIEFINQNKPDIFEPF